MKQKYIAGLVILNIFVFSVITVLGVIMLFHSSYAIPTAWDGNTASSFAGGNGTEDDPYLISNGGQLAFFIEKCNSDSNYRDKYYKLTADITLNDGYFDYKNEHEFYYFKNNIKYYINNNKYYNFSNQEIGSLKQLPVSNFNFAGTFDGDNHYIYGLYSYSNTDVRDYGFLSSIGSSSVFRNVKFLNSAIIGNSEFLGLIGYSSGTVENVLYSGLIKNLGILDDIGYSSISGNTITLNSHTYGFSVLYILEGITDKAFTYNGQNYGPGAFSIVFNTQQSSVAFQSSETLSLSNLKYYSCYYEHKTGLLGGIDGSSSNIDKCAVSGKVIGSYGYTGGIVGYVFGDNYTLDLNRSYNTALVLGFDYVGGIVGFADPSGTAKLNLTNVYNSGKVESSISSPLITTYTGGLIGYVNSTIKVKFKYCINHSSSNLNGQFVGRVLNDDVTNITATDNNYYTTAGTYPVGGYNDNIPHISRLSFNYLTTLSRLRTTLKYGDYDPNSTDPNAVWTVESGKLPWLYFDDKTAPSVEVRVANNSSNYLSWTDANSRSTLGVTRSDIYGTFSASSSSSDVAFIEYYIDNNYSTTPLPVDFTNSTLGYTAPVNISNNFCTTGYARVTDIYGNVNYAYTNVVLNDKYQGTPYIDSESDSVVTAEDLAMSDSVFNVSFKRYYTKSSGDSFPYGNDEKQYLMLSNQLPVGTELNLYDKNSHENYRYSISSNTVYTEYTSNSETYYLLDLESFWSIRNSSTFYSNSVSGFGNGDTYNCDIVISFVFPTNLASNYEFYKNSKYTSLVDYSASNGVVSGSYNVGTIIARKSAYTQTAYTLTDSSNLAVSSNSLSLDTLDMSYSVSLSLKRFLYNISLNSSSIHIKSKRDKYKKFLLKVEFYKNNNLLTSPFVGANLKYTFTDSSGSKIFNNKSNSGATVDFDIGDWDSLNGQYNFTVNIDTLGNNYRNILPSDEHYILFKVFSSDGELLGSYKQKVGVQVPKSMDNYTFYGLIDDQARIIDHVTGKNMLDTNESNFTYYYTNYASYNQTMEYSIKKVSSSSYNSFVSVSPSDLLVNGSYYPITNSNSFTLNYQLCAVATNCVDTFKFKNNIAQGTYIVSAILKREGKTISTEQFNFVVK